MANSTVCSSVSGAFLRVLFLLILSTSAFAGRTHPRTGTMSPPIASDPALVWPNITGFVPDLDCPSLPGWPAERLAAEAAGPPSAIPAALHFVWVGGRPLPEKYCANLASFVSCLAPDAWSINLWTDGPLPPCLPGSVAVRNATRFIRADRGLAHALAARTNVGYKADLVRYALLAALGGVYSDIDATCLRSPAHAWRDPGGGGFVAWTGDPYWNLSNALEGFPVRSAIAAAVRACALAHAPTTPHTFIPYISGPSFFTTAVAQAVGAYKQEGGGSGQVAAAHNPHHGRHHHHVRLLPQPLFLTGQAVDGVPPFTVQTNDYNWKE